MCFWFTSAGDVNRSWSIACHELHHEENGHGSFGGTNNRLRIMYQALGAVAFALAVRRLLCAGETDFALRPKGTRPMCISCL